MSKLLPNVDAYIQGNVEKLVQVANVQGDLIIVNEKAGEKVFQEVQKNLANYRKNLTESEKKDIWEGEKGEQRLNRLTQLENHLDQFQLFVEDTQSIELTLKSERFGSKIKLKVPYEMKVWACLDYVVETLALPQTQNIKKLGITIVFKYALHRGKWISSQEYKGEYLAPSMSLREAGLSNGDELDLQIDISVEDPLLQSKENKLQSMYHASYLTEPPGGIQKLIAALESEVKTRREKSWSLDQKYAESIGAEPWFAHLSAQETTTSHPKPFFHFPGKFLDEAMIQAGMGTVVNFRRSIQDQNR